MSRIEQGGGVNTAAQSEAITYNVRLRTPLVRYFRTRLSRTYDMGDIRLQSETAESPLMALMNKLTAIEEDPDQQRPQTVVALSQDEVDFMTQGLPIPDPNNYAGFKIHTGLVDELRDNFQGARNLAAVKKGFTKIRSIIKRPKT